MAELSPYWQRRMDESTVAYRDRKKDEDEGWKPWMRKAKPSPREGVLCPGCRVKRGVAGGCFCD